MIGKFFCIGRVSRGLSTGGIEEITFQPGVNLLIGPPNTGKTKWLQMLDYALGDSSTFESTFDEVLWSKYDFIRVELKIGDESIWIERRWKDIGNKGKVFINDVGMTTREFQQHILFKLQIPILHFPRGNPFSGQTWPELSFRMLLRHIYRQQRFWSGLADQQIEAEQHACLLQFLGLAEDIYSEEFGELIKLKLEVERLKARRDQYQATLTALSQGLLTDVVGSSPITKDQVDKFDKEILDEQAHVLQRRALLLAKSKDSVFADSEKDSLKTLSERRAILLVAREEQLRRQRSAEERIEEMLRYKADLLNELDRLERAQDAGRIFADLKVTHCPACDQTVAPISTTVGDCHLCRQHLPPAPVVGMGKARLEFESKRIGGELVEANDLLRLLGDEVKMQATKSSQDEEELRMIENELKPAREAVSALVSAEVSAMDMELGELSERQRQITRLKGAVELGEQLDSSILEKEALITPLQSQVDRQLQDIDYGVAEDRLAQGIQSYLDAINELKPNVWRHSNVNANLSRSGFSIKIGNKRWNSALGGTDTLYFLMSYHFGLLTLSSKAGCHYPGLSIIDLPGDFLGESIEDKENFIVKPFIDLVSSDGFEGSQVIMTGASFKGLAGVNRISLDRVYVQ